MGFVESKNLFKMESTKDKGQNTVASYEREMTHKHRRNVAIK